MKVLFGRATFVWVIAAALMIGGVLARPVFEAAAAETDVPVAHLTFSRRSIAFGMVKVATTKSLTIRNMGNTDANVTVNAPTGPFSLTAGGGSYPVAPGVAAIVSVQFAPTAKGPVTGEAEIQCSNCSTAANDDVVIHLRGNAEGAVAAPVESPTPTPGATPTPSANNSLPMSVTAGPFEMSNQPFASVTICATGTSNCTTVNDVLVDTGSFGLRIFGSQLSGLGVTPKADGDGELGECAFFGAGSTWGGVTTVDVTMAGEPTITIPIQVIDDINAFSRAPRDCTQGTQLIASPQAAGFYGILGIGSISNDTIAADYFDCSGESCSAIDSPPNTGIVPNPVSSLPVDNNGVVVSLPSISSSGAQTANGTIYFGIGTENNNQPGAVETYQQNSDPNSVDYLNINTVYKGNTADGFFDTGSTGYFFNDTSITECSDGSGLYCPEATLSESATNQSVGTSVSGVVDFKISNADSLIGSSNEAFEDLGGTFDGGDSYDGFDWGLPFFFGRTVYVGIAGTSSPLGTGPYTAY
jgi:hypothetical protein